MGDARWADRAGYDEIGERSVPREPVRVFAQHGSGCAQLFRVVDREIQPEPVWRVIRRAGEERQSVLLRRLRAEVSAARSTVYGGHADSGDAQRRFQPGPVRATEYNPTDESVYVLADAFHVRSGRRAAAGGGEWNTAGRNAVQQDSTELDQSNRAGADQHLSVA